LLNQAAVVEVSSYQMELPGLFHPKVKTALPHKLLIALRQMQEWNIKPMLLTAK
jgi:hypothetical protein